MFAPVLVGVGTAVAMELRRLSTRPPDAKLMDELKGTQTRLTKLVAKLESDLQKEKTGRAAADTRASDLAKATADLKKAQVELGARLKAAEAKATRLTQARDALARKAETLQQETDAARAQLTAALEALKADVAKALAKYAKGGFGKKGAQGLLKALAKSGVAVEATPEDFAALAAAPASSARVELSVDSASFARKLTLVTDDPDRIARALAAGTAVTGGRYGALDTARVSLPLRPVKTPPKALLAAAVAAAAAKSASALEGATKLRRPASPPKPPTLESDSPPSSPRLKAARADKPAAASSGPRFRLKAMGAPAKRAPPPSVPRLGLDVGVTGRADGTHRLDVVLDDGDDMNATRDLALR